MTYIIVTETQTVIGAPFASFNAALNEASRLFGEDTGEWIALNLRIEENR